MLSILGLTSYPTFGSLAVHQPALAAGVKKSAVQTGSLTPQDFANQYNLSPLYASGANGQGTTIGIVTLATLDPSGPIDFWSNVLGISTLANRITQVNVDGGSGPVSAAAGSGETALDVEQSGGLAPQAKIVVYQAPNTDYGFVDGFFTAASQNIADSVSASWGESETVIQAAVNTGTESPTYAISFDEAYLELAAQGQSTFVSAGDFGAYTPIEDLGTTNLGAGNPDSSPWVTAAGGTTLGGTIPLTSTDSAVIPAERTWGWDWLWPHYADFGFPSEESLAFSNPLGGGGGFSVYEPTPAYQRFVPSAHHFSAAEYLTPIDFQTVAGMNLPTGWSFNPSPSITTGWGTGRATPDVSADADPFTGYLLDFQGSVQAGGRYQLRGTSAQRVHGSDRLAARPPGGAVEPGHLPLRHVIALAVHSAGHGERRQHQPLLHRHARPDLQRRLWPRHPEPGQAGPRLRAQLVRARPGQTRHQVAGGSRAASVRSGRDLPAFWAGARADDRSQNGYGSARNG